jgi:Amt family ammonium transporter
VHGVGGMLGSALVSVFTAAAVGGVGFAAGMDFPRQLGAQVLAIAVAALWSAGVTFVLVRVLRPITGLRVDAEREFDGLDFTTHGERAYDYAG